MAVSLSKNLKLRVDSNLTANSQYNLQRLDLLGSVYQIDTNNSTKVRSQSDIQLLPNDTDVGGSGVGGTITLGTADQPASSVTIYADSFSNSGGFGLLDSGSGFSVNLLAPSLTADVSLTMPDGVGTANQVLTTDGVGNLSWSNAPTLATLSDTSITSPALNEVLLYNGSQWVNGTVSAGAGIGSETAFTWAPGDGIVKTITHNLGTRQVVATVLDETNNYQTIEVPDTTRPNDNQIILTSTSPPAGGNWLVLLKQIIT